MGEAEVSSSSPVPQQGQTRPDQGPGILWVTAASRDEHLALELSDHRKNILPSFLSQLSRVIYTSFVCESFSYNQVALLQKIIAMGTVITIDNFTTALSPFDPAISHSNHLYGLVDMGR